MSEQEREKQGVREDEVSKWKIGQHREWNWQEILQQQIAAGLVAAEPFRCPTCGHHAPQPDLPGVRQHHGSEDHD